VELLRRILIVLACCTMVWAQDDSILTEKGDIINGTIIYAQFYSVFIQTDSVAQMAIPTETIKRLTLSNGDELIGPGIPNRVYYKFVDGFDSFPSLALDTSRYKPPQAITARVIEERLAEVEDSMAVTLFEWEDDVLDADGNSYRSIRIGNQVWMAENLRVTHFQDSSLVPLTMDARDWVETDSAAWCLYEDQDSYGILYNWFAVSDPRGLAPEGWHIPTDEEWMELEETLGMLAVEAEMEASFRGEDIAGMLTGEAERWDKGVLRQSPKFAETPFKALPGGYRGYLNGTFSNWGRAAFYWTATPAGDRSAWYRSLKYDRSGVFRDQACKQVGMAIRCIKDAPPEEQENIFYTQFEDGELLQFSPVVRDRILKAEIWRGMTTEMALMSLGEPEKINRTEYDFTVYERWVYPEGKYLFFESGVLSSWQESQF